MPNKILDKVPKFLGHPDGSIGDFSKILFIYLRTMTEIEMKM